MTKLHTIGPVRGLDGLRGSYAGFALGLVRTRLALVDGGVAHLGDLDPGDRRGGERLAWLRKAILDFLRRAQPDAAAVRGYRHGDPGAYDTGELGGLARMSLHESGTRHLVVPPGILDMTVGDGRSLHGDALLRHLVQRWGVQVDGDAEADACALGIIAACVANPTIALPGRQRAALATLNMET